MGAAAASAASVASLGLTVAGDLMGGSAKQAENDYQAARLEEAAQFGKTQAALTDAVMRENLNNTLGNIQAVRAAAGIDPTSPTTAAMMNMNADTAERQRLAKVGSINAQTAEQEASAKYLREAGDFAVTQSYVKAGLDVGDSFAKSKFGFGA